jgi:hypothetical protein
LGSRDRKRIARWGHIDHYPNCGWLGEAPAGGRSGRAVLGAQGAQELVHDLLQLVVRGRGELQGLAVDRDP